MSDKSELVIFKKTNRGRSRDKRNPTWKREMTKKNTPMMNKDPRYPLISVRNVIKMEKWGREVDFY